MWNIDLRSPRYNMLVAKAHETCPSMPDTVNIWALEAQVCQVCPLPDCTMQCCNIQVCPLYHAVTNSVL